MAETPPKVWNRLALAALLFMCFAVSHLIATHMKSMITVAPVSVQADLKNRETKSTWDTHIPRVNISAALAARLEDIRAERAAPGYRGRYPGEEAWWGGLRRREKVLVLSPVRRTNARRQKRFVKLLLSLDWDRRDLSVATLVSPDSVAVCEAADAALRDAKPPFASVTTFLEPAGLAGLNTGDQESGARHKLEHQLARRSAIARARNHLAVAAVGASDAEWVLWLDNDLLSYGADLLLQLRASDVDVVVPTCYCSGGDACGSGVYDRNSWAETPASAAKLRELDAAGRGDALVVHGYGAATATAPGGEAIVSMDGRRRFLDDLRTDALAPLVPLGGVGATCILLRADLVREGLSFPSFALNHAIESEGIAQMALKMGARVYGRTDVAIIEARRDSTGARVGTRSLPLAGGTRDPRRVPLVRRDGRRGAWGSLTGSTSFSAGASAQTRPGWSGVPKVASLSGASRSTGTLSRRFAAAGVASRGLPSRSLR